MAKKRKSIFQRVRKTVRSVARRVGIGVKTTKDVFSVADEIKDLRSVTTQVNLLEGQGLTGKQLEATLVNLRAQLDPKRRRSRDVKIDWTKAELNNITSRVQMRLFQKGLNSEDLQMRKAERTKNSAGQTRLEPYRTDTGELFRSIRVTVANSRGDLQLSFKREKVVIDSIIDMYGDPFSWSPSDKAFVTYLALKSEGVLPRGAKAPGIVSKGQAPYNKSKRRRSR